MLEDKIRKNRDLFDGAEPAEGHLGRFQDKLEASNNTDTRREYRMSGRFFRVAAVITVIMGLSILYYLVDPSFNTSQLAANTLPQEVQEARMYYNKLAEEKLVKINDCASSTAEASYIQKIVEDEIILLDSSSVQLEIELQKDNDNPRVINALLRNYKTKSDLLDDILNRLCHI
jgi:hypothetical protein